jgi:hypothetical protein
MPAASAKIKEQCVFKHKCRYVHADYAFRCGNKKISALQGSPAPSSPLACGT